MSNIPFDDQLTGFRLVKKTNTSTGSFTEQTVTETVILSGTGTKRLLEPMTGRYRQQIIDQYGMQQGQVYAVYLNSDDGVTKKDMANYYAYFDLEAQKQNLDYTSFTTSGGQTIPNGTSATLRVIDILDGGLGINQKQLVCVTQN
jgi:hypothetical protein